MKKIILSLSLVFVLMFVFVGITEAKLGLDSVKSTPGLVTDEPSAVIGNIIQAVLGLVGIILVVMIIWGGIAYATSAGKEEKLTQAKKILTYAIVGVVIVALAFALTRYVLQAFYKSGGASTPANTSNTQTDPF